MSGPGLGMAWGAGSAGSGALVWAFAAVATSRHAEKSAARFIGSRFLLFSRRRDNPDEFSRQIGFDDSSRFIDQSERSARSLDRWARAKTEGQTLLEMKPSAR